MYKILIAEDEKWIRAGLIKTVDWSSFGFDTILEAADGRSALETALAEKPDAIIADIKMPRMTGIEMTENLRQSGSDVYVILISGFSEFVYAQRAIQCGVHEYLLKPLDTAKLEEALRKCRAWLDERNDPGTDAQGEKYSRYLSIAQRHFAHEFICSGACAPEEAVGSMHELGLYRDGQEMLVAVVRFMESETDSDRMTSVLNELCGDSCRCIFHGKDPNEICVLFAGDEGKPMRIPEDICERARKEYGLRLVCGCGSAEPPERLAKSYKKAVEGCDYQFFTYGKETSDTPGTISDNPMLPSYTQLLNLLLSENYNAARKHVSQRFEALSKQVREENATELRASLTGKMNHVFSECRARGLFQKDDELSRMLDGLPFRLTLEDTRNLIEDMICSLENRGDESRSSSGQLVQSAIAYVRAHYFENISMNTVAKYLCVNPSYFSHVFSEQMKIPFTKYLNSYRIMIARQLLDDPAIKIYEVAHLVGFDDYRYFSKIFKEMEGIPPDQYRNLLSDE